MQRYVTNPYLLDGLKFDLRLYVLVTSCHPLTIFWHKEGIARFATQPYALASGKEMSEKAHLTNYAINKDAPDFKITKEDIEAGTSSKRTLETVYKRLAQDGVDINLLKLKIADLIIKTLISVQPDLLHNYRTCQPNDRTFNMCFEILGFDVLIDADTKPWLLEVNQAPSFMTDSELDYNVKKAVIRDTFSILGITEANRQKNLDRILRDRELKKMHKQSTLFWNQMRGEEFAREIEERRVHQINNLGGFYKVFPVEDADQSFSGGLFRNSISKKAKSYYAKFEKNGNMQVAGQTGQGILQNLIKQKKQHQHAQGPNKSAENVVVGQQQILPMAALPTSSVRTHNFSTNPAMMTAHANFQGIDSTHTIINKAMASSGSSIKLRAMQRIGHQQHQQHSTFGTEGQAVKQKVFSLPKEVNGVTSITQTRLQEITKPPEYPSAEQQSILNLVTQVGSIKRHTSVEPNASQKAGALIPNGLNNGRVYRRQSSDQNPNSTNGNGAIS